MTPCESVVKKIMGEPYAGNPQVRFEEEGGNPTFTLRYIDGMNLYGGYFVNNGLDPFGLCNTIKPSAESGWTYDENKNKWSIVIDSFEKNYMTDAEKLIGEKSFQGFNEDEPIIDLGCVGITHCMLQKDNLYLRKCFDSEAKALESAHNRDCPSPEKGCVFAIRYWEKNLERKKKLNKEMGRWPVKPGEIKSGRGSKADGKNTLHVS